MLRIELVRAEENSPRREPWGSCEIAKPRHGAEDCGGAIFRPLPGALPLTPHSHGLRRGLLSFALRAGEIVLAHFQVGNHVSLNGAYEEFSSSKTAVIGARRVKLGSISAA